MFTDKLFYFDIKTINKNKVGLFAEIRFDHVDTFFIKFC